jgi:hypothetical protein
MNMLADNVFKPIREDPRFIAAQERLKPYAEKKKPAVNTFFPDIPEQATSSSVLEKLDGSEITAEDMEGFTGGVIAAV